MPVTGHPKLCGRLSGACTVHVDGEPVRLKAVEPKLQAFYDSLDAKQKKAFDTGGRIGGIFDWWGKK